MPSIPSEDELKDAVNEILRTNDLEKITLRMVMTMLGERFECAPADLASRKRFVRNTITEFLDESYDPAESEKNEDNTSSKKRKASSSTANADPKPVKLTGLERAVVLAEPLADFIGQPVISRSHIPKKISAYAKEHSLHDPNDGRKIICDEALKTALGVPEFTFFSLAKLVSGLVYKPEECSDELQAMARECEEKLLEEKIRKRDEDLANGVFKEPKKSAKKQKVAKQPGERTRKPSGLLKPMQLSEALIAVCGETQLPRSEVLKKIWEHIRNNELQDPNNKSQILCDEKLKAICDNNASIPHMGINKYLSAHMTKID